MKERLSESARDSISPLYRRLSEKIVELGLDDFGVAPVCDAESFDVFVERVRKGYCADMSYLTDNLEARRSPTSVMSDARSAIVVALSEKRLRDESRDLTEQIFNAPELSRRDSDSVGVVSGYATCLDYHDALKKRLKGLAQFCREAIPNVSARCAVDTAPILEKELAVRAGLGFCCLNTLVINPKLGTRFFLGEVLLSASFSEITGFDKSSDYLRFRAEEASRAGLASRARKPQVPCGRCVAACPTGALLGDGSLDARRCVNYWTIESREEIPPEIVEALGGRVFGCDICQRVCPYNTDVESAEPRKISLDGVAELDDAAFRRLFKKTPVFRARLEGLQRTARAVKNDAQNGDLDTTKDPPKDATNEKTTARES